METTEKKLTKKEREKLQIEEDRQRAERLITDYEKLVNKENTLKTELFLKTKPFVDDFEKIIKPIKASYQDRLTSLKASIDETAKELLEIGKRQRQTLFAVDGNWIFENGYYIHAKKETVPVFGVERLKEPGDDFNLSKFVRTFGDYVDVKFKIKELKTVFLDGNSDDRRKMLEMNFDLTLDESLEIKELKKPKAKEPKE